MNKHIRLKTIVIAWLAVMAFVITGHAQFLPYPAGSSYSLESWETAPIPPTNNPSAYDGGWQRGQGGFGPNGSIFAPSNYPAYFTLVTNAAAGYPQSLDEEETGYGADRLYISLSPAQIAAFTNNWMLNFTFSCPSNVNNDSGGYMQLVQFQCNSPGTGFSGPAVSTTGGFSETGATNNDANGQPVFDFYSGSPARSQVVTWNYLSKLPAIQAANETYVQFVLVWQSGGSDLTNFYINNVNLSGPGSPMDIVDQFNPTNNPYAGTNIYADFDEITNVYNLWGGYGGNTAVNQTNIIWCATNDANGNPNSGSIQLTANWGGANQFLVWDLGPGNTYPGISPPITNFVTGVSFDIMYSPSSPVVTNGTTPVYGFFELADITASYGIDDIATYSYPQASNGWVHVSAALNPLTDNNLQSISKILLKQYSGFYAQLSGTATLWVDNIEFTYTNVTPAIPPPVVSIQKATPALRIFTGSPTDIYGRAEVRTVAGDDVNWVNNASSGTPTTYTYKLLDYNPAIGQTHIFLIPVNNVVGGSAQTYNGLDYSDASNLLWMVLNPGPTNSVLCSIQWKTNTTGANPNHTDLTFTNGLAVGTWTLEFTGPGTGFVLPPGNTPQAFTLSDPNISTDFASPVQAYFGMQPNGNSAGMGQYEDYAYIAISNSAYGAPIYEDFTHEGSDFQNNQYGASGNSPDLSPSGYFDSSLAEVEAGITIVRTNLDAYWFKWNIPNAAQVFYLNSVTNLGATNWVNPAWYFDYNDNQAPRAAASQLGPYDWELLPTDDVPRTDGQFGVAISPQAYYIVSTNENVNPQ